MNFIHVPKTGGLSIRDSLPVKYWGHVQASSVPRPRFAFVRNPYERIRSAFHWNKGGCFGGIEKAAAERLRGADFSTWVVQQDESLLDGDDVYKPMVHWLDAPVDYLGRYESFEDDFRAVAHGLGVDVSPPHLNSSVKTGEYTEAARVRVAELYAEDFRRYGYEV